MEHTPGPPDAHPTLEACPICGHVHLAETCGVEYRETVRTGGVVAGCPTETHNRICICNLRVRAEVLGETVPPSPEPRRSDLLVTVLCCACRQPVEMSQAEAQRWARRMFRNPKLGCEHQVEGSVNCPPPLPPRAAEPGDEEVAQSAQPAAPFNPWNVTDGVHAELISVFRSCRDSGLGESSAILWAVRDNWAAIMACEPQAEEREARLDSVNQTAHVREPAPIAGVLDVLRNLDKATMLAAVIQMTETTDWARGDSELLRYQRFVKALGDVLATRTETDEVAEVARKPGMDREANAREFCEDIGVDPNEWEHYIPALDGVLERAGASAGE